MTTDQPERLAAKIDLLRDWLSELPEGPWFVSDCEGELQVWREAALKVTGRTESGEIATYNTPNPFSRSGLVFDADLESWDHGQDADDDKIRAVAQFLALARNTLPDLLAEVDRLQAERDAALALSPSHRRGDFGPLWQQHAAPEAMAHRLTKLRLRRDAMDRLIARLEALHVRRTAERDAGTWPYRDGDEQPVPSVSLSEDQTRAGQSNADDHPNGSADD